MFSRTDSVFGPGHACFLSNSMGKPWIIYHAAKAKGSGWDRDVRAQLFDWRDDGSPIFGRPVPAGIPISVPTKATMGPEGTRGGLGLGS